MIVRGGSYEERLQNLLTHISKAPSNSLILASELCLSGYEAPNFAGINSMIATLDSMLIDRLQNALTPSKFLGFTRMVSLNDSGGLGNMTKFKARVYNEFLLLNSVDTFHKRSKSKLFEPNNEDEIFACGSDESVKIFDFNGMKVGVLICFELRFVELWARLKGCDVVLVPAMWGESRKDDFITLCKALAVLNHCYVVASSSLDLEFGGVFLPSGDLAEGIEFDKELINGSLKRLRRDR